MEELPQRFVLLEERVSAIEPETSALRNENAELRRTQATTSTATRRSESTSGGGIDTRLMNKPDTFSGKDEDWPSFALMTRAYFGALNPRFIELIKKAENPNESIDAVDLDPGDEPFSSQMYYILSMLCKGPSQDKVALAGLGESLEL